MKRLLPLLPLLLTGVPLLAQTPPKAPAPPAVAEDDGINTLTAKAQQAIQLADWAVGLKILTEVVDRYGPDAKVEFGAQFGSILFNKGVCEFQLKKYEEAKTTFKKCFEEFPNTLNADAKAGEAARTVNVHWLVSCFQWANAEQNLGNFDAALALYEKFKSSASANPKAPNPITEGIYNLSVGMCYARKGDMAKAMPLIEGAIAKREAWKLQEKDIFQAFTLLARAWVDNGKKSEADAMAFLNKHGASMKISPWECAKGGYAGLLTKIAGDATKAGMGQLAVRMTEFVPSTEDVIADLYTYAKGGVVTPRLQEEIAKYQMQLTTGEPIELFSLMSLATAYESLGSHRAGLLVYEHLLNQFPKSKYRPQMLFSLARAAFGMGDHAAVQMYGEKFQAEYPNHELADEVSALMLDQLFASGAYAQCLEVGNKIRASLKPGAKERELPDYVIAGSLYYTGKFEAAAEELDAHLKNYPTGPYRESILFHKGANLTKLARWDEAAVALDEFIKTYPKAAFLDLVLQERAGCHYAKNEFEPCLAAVDRIEKEFPESQTLDRALILKANVLSYQKKGDEALKFLHRAADLAGEKAHKDTAAQALSLIIGITGRDEKKNAETLKAFDEFKAKYAGTYWEASAAVGAMQALVAAKRGQDGLDRLEAVIVEVGKNPDSPDLDKIINSYSKFYAEVNGPVKLVERLKAFPNVPADNPTLKSWLMISRLDAYEAKENTRIEFPNKEGEIKALIDELAGMNKADLPAYVLYRIGRKLQLGGLSTVARAMPWYEELQKRTGTRLKDQASLGIAQVKAEMADAGSQDQALKLLRGVMKDMENPELKEEACVSLGRLLVKQNKWPAALDEAIKPYLTQDKWQKSRPEFKWLEGRAQQEASKKDEALKAYSVVYTLYGGYIRYSADAWVRSAQMMNAAGDTKGAYALMRDMVWRMGQLEGHKDDEARNIPKARELREKWAAELGINVTKEDAERDKLKAPAKK